MRILVPAENVDASLRRRLLSLGMVMVVAIVYLVLIDHPDWWSVVISPPSFAKSGIIFADMQGHLAASQAYAEGKLVHGQPVSGDPLNRVHAGPVWMLWLGLTGLKSSHYPIFTSACLAAFLFSCAWLLRPADWIETAVTTSCLTSPSALLLVERGNIDLMVFSFLTLAFAGMGTGSARGQWTGWAITAGFVGFKYYPALAFVAFLGIDAPRRRRLAMLGAGAILTLAFVGWTLEEIRTVATQQAVNRYFPFFGARELLLLAGIPRANATWLGAFGWLVSASLLAWVLGPTQAIEKRSDRRQIAFMGGSAILSFSFIATTSPDYRTIFFLFSLPWLLGLIREPHATPALRRTALSCVGLFLLVAWFAALGAWAAVTLDASAQWWWTIVVIKQSGWWLLMLLFGALMLRQTVVRIRELLA